jgi:drug/metabolite transporter (DMT)-like permease
MSWQLLISLTVLLFSVNGLLHRVLMSEENSDAYTQSVAFTGLVGIFALVIAVLQGKLQTSFTVIQLMYFIPMLIIGTAGNIVTFKSLQLIESSEHTILITSSKLWLLAGTLFVLQEPFSARKIAGAVIILAGVVVAQWRKGKFVFNLGAWFALIAAFCFGASDVLSYLILRNFDANSLIVYFCFASAGAMILLKPGTVKKLSFYKKPRRAMNIIIVSVNDTLASLCAFLAYQVGRNAMQIGPLGATQTIVTVLLALIFLRERDNLPQKLIGAVTVVCGTALIL